MICDDNYGIKCKFVIIHNNIMVVYINTRVSSRDIKMENKKLNKQTKIHTHIIS